MQSLSPSLVLTCRARWCSSHAQPACLGCCDVDPVSEWCDDQAGPIAQVPVTYDNINVACLPLQHLTLNASTAAGCQKKSLPEGWC